jgi:hypothetical protein
VWSGEGLLESLFYSRAPRPPGKIHHTRRALDTRRRLPRTAPAGGGGGDRREAGERSLTSNDGPSDARADAFKTRARSGMEAGRVGQTLVAAQRDTTARGLAVGGGQTSRHHVEARSI